MVIQIAMNTATRRLKAVRRNVRRSNFSDVKFETLFQRYYAKPSDR
jgi:hypothetical protein